MFEDAVEKDIIAFLEEIVSNPAPLGYNLTVSVEKEDQKTVYLVPKGECLSSFPDAVEDILEKINAYKKEYGVEAARQEIEKAPTMRKEIEKTGEYYKKRLTEILSNSHAA